MCCAVLLAATRLTPFHTGVPISITQTKHDYHSWTILKNRTKTLVLKLAQIIQDIQNYLVIRHRVILVMLVEYKLAARFFFPSRTTTKLPNRMILTKLRLLILVLIITRDLLKIYQMILFRMLLGTWKWLILELNNKRSQVLEILRISKGVIKMKRGRISR